MKYAVCILSLGYTRLAGITLYDSQTRAFEETTPREARNLINAGLVKGVKWEKDGFVPDESFNMKNILVKTAVGKYRPLLNDLPGVQVNSTYMVVRVIETENEKWYEVVSNKCQRIKISESALIGLNEIDNVPGVRIDGNQVTVCDGVVIKKKMKKENIEITDLPLNVNEEDAVAEEETECTEKKTEDTEEKNGCYPFSGDGESSNQADAGESLAGVFENVEVIPDNKEEIMEVKVDDEAVVTEKNTKTSKKTKVQQSKKS